MRKLYLLSAVFTGLLLVACETTSSKPQVKNDLDDVVSEKWLNDDTLQVRAVGAPHVGAKGLVRRRAQSEESALEAAQRRVFIICVGAEINRFLYQDDGSELAESEVSREFTGIVKDSSIAHRAFDQDDNCEITYRTTSKGFKKQCEAMTSKRDFH